MPEHKTMDQLKASLPEILAAPKDAGELKLMVIRPASGVRTAVEACDVSFEKGMHGDHWSKGCWKTTDDGAPHPDVQICLMNARCIEQIAGERSNWPPAGDNLFVDIDLSYDNLPVGQRLAIGTAVMEITDTRHKGCDAFIERYGRDACVFVNVGDGDKHNLRGTYARVVEAGTINVGDTLRKI